MGSNFIDPRRPRNRMLDIILGAASQQFPLRREEEDLVRFGAPPAQDHDPITRPDTPPPTGGNPRAQDDEAMYADYEKALRTPVPDEKRPAWWKQALGYATRTVGGPLAGTDIPERLIVGDDNLKVRRQRAGQMAAAKELGGIEKDRAEYGIKGRETSVKERGAGVAERGATTDESKQQFARDTYLTDAQIKLAQAGLEPEGGAVEIGDSAGNKSKWKSRKRTTAIPEQYRATSGGLEEIPNEAVTEFIRSLNKTADEDVWSSAGSGVIYNKKTGKYLRVEPIEGVEARQPGDVLTRGEKIVGTVPGSPKATASAQQRALQRYNDTVRTALQKFTNETILSPGNREQEEAVLQTLVEQAEAAYRAEAGPNAPPPPDPLVDTEAAEEAVRNKLSSMAPRPPIGPTSPANVQPPPSGQTVPAEPAQPAAAAKPANADLVEKNGWLWRREGNVMVPVRQVQ